MTNNITPIEALNEIDKQITQINLEYSSNYKIRRFQEGQLDSLNFAKQILTQALASQECEVTYLSLDEKLYCVLEDLKDYSIHKSDKEIDWIIEQIESVKTDVESIMPQQKTFTVDEIKGKAQYVYFNYDFIGKVMVNNYINVLLAEFEKAVDRWYTIDCT